ncbi:hypothetical protein ACQ86G_28400 [Roseateles chitinivorans]|uniref:hypothetical protein n=1 Tax=Roseateles chitinivorans TaxID=2917965 RepID=UPI003D66466E
MSAAMEAWALLGAYPLRWLAIALVFLVVVEATMFIPRVGFTLKLALASVFGAQIVALFHGAAQGAVPSVFDLWRGLALPADGLAVLVVGTLIPFAAGLIYLRVVNGPASLRFFFGSVVRDKPPKEREFVRFKYVMQLASLPFTWLAGTVVLLGLGGVPAMSTALAAARFSWEGVVLLGVMGIVFEWAAVALPRRLPRVAGIALVSVMLVGYLLWSFALLYTLSVKALTL